MAHDAFDLLGLPSRFDLAAAEIQDAYLRRAAAAHPDRAMGGHTGSAQGFVTDAGDGDAHAAALNRARQVLVNPESRADELLRRLGGPSREADRSLPDGFLMQMMDIRERIDHETRSGNAAAMETWLDWAEQRRREHIANISRILADIDAASDRPQRLAAARRELNAWRYIERLVEQLESDE